MAKPNPVTPQAEPSLVNEKITDKELSQEELNQKLNESREENQRHLARIDKLVEHNTNQSAQIDRLQGELKDKEFPELTDHNQPGGYSDELPSQKEIYIAIVTKACHVAGTGH